MLAFVGLSLALLAAIAVTMFVELRNIHEDEIKQDLGARAVGVEYAVNLEPQSQWDATVSDLAAPIVADGGYVLVQGPAGKIRAVVGTPPSLTLPQPGRFHRQRLRVRGAGSGRHARLDLRLRDAE